MDGKFNLKVFLANFFKLIKERIPAGYSMNSYLATILSLTRDSIYKIRNGCTNLQLEYYIILCRKFNIVMDYHTMEESDTKRILEKFDFPVNDLKRYKKYLTLIYERIAQKADDPDISWAAVLSHTPVFHILAFPELTLFHMYMRYPINPDNKLSFESYVQDAQLEEIKELHEKIYLILKGMNSVEIFDENVFVSLKDQIVKIYRKGGFEKRETAIRLLGQLIDMVNQIKKWSGTGNKDGLGQYKLHYSEMRLSKNKFLFYDKDKACGVFSSYMGSSILLNTKKEDCKMVENVLVELKRMNSCMCGIGDTKRNEIFNNYTNQLQDTINKLH